MHCCHNHIDLDRRDGVRCYRFMCRLICQWKSEDKLDQSASREVGTVCCQTRLRYSALDLYCVGEYWQIIWHLYIHHCIHTISRGGVGRAVRSHKPALLYQMWRVSAVANTHTRATEMCCGQRQSLTITAINYSGRRYCQLSWATTAPICVLIVLELLMAVWKSI